jgi:hypothetical protein
LGDIQQMKLDVDPFLMDMINFEEKKVLVRTDRANTTKGKRVVVSDDLRQGMMRSRNLEVGVWKENVPRKSYTKWKLTSSFLMEKYMRR